jgi:hypothetical protein
MTHVILINVSLIVILVNAILINATLVRVSLINVILPNSTAPFVVLCFSVSERLKQNHININVSFNLDQFRVDQ